MSLRKRLADPVRKNSIAAWFRGRRLEWFTAMLDQVPGPTVNVIDLGGMVGFWERWGLADSDRVRVTVINLAAQEQRHENIIPVVGDATEVDERDGSFDIAFSNSTIEHVGRKNREKMAGEVRRLAPRYFVQTPNFWFPIEPHSSSPAGSTCPVAPRKV